MEYEKIQNGHPPLRRGPHDAWSPMPGDHAGTSAPDRVHTNDHGRIPVDSDESKIRPLDHNLTIAVDPHESKIRPLDHNLTIAVDFDGVLFDHVPYLLRGFRDAHDIDLGAEGLRHWDFFQYRAVRERGLTWACVHKVLHAIETDLALHLEAPRDRDAATVMAAWRAQGHHVSIVTARHASSREATELFLREHGVPHDALRMGVSLKTGYDVLVDDAPHNVLTAAASGSHALLMDHPYNRDVPTKGNPRRVFTWREVGRVVDAMARARAGRGAAAAGALA